MKSKEEMIETMVRAMSDRQMISDTLLEGDVYYKLAAEAALKALCGALPDGRNAMSNGWTTDKNPEQYKEWYDQLKQWGK